MELKLDEEAITRAIESQSIVAVTEAFGRWEVKEAISKSISRELMEGVVSKALSDALAKMDHESLVNRLATEIERSVTRAVIHLTEEGVVQVVAKLRNISEYGEEAAKARRDLRAELFGR